MFQGYIMGFQGVPEDLKCISRGSHGYLEVSGAFNRVSGRLRGYQGYLRGSHGTPRGIEGISGAFK